jgi:hypothetical protein
MELQEWLYVQLKNGKKCLMKYNALKCVCLFHYNIWGDVKSQIERESV